MTGRWTELLNSLTRVPGVRGAMVVSAEDGLVVAESSMQGALDTIQKSDFVARPPRMIRVA